MVVIKRFKYGRPETYKIDYIRRVYELLVFGHHSYLWGYHSIIIKCNEEPKDLISLRQSRIYEVIEACGFKKEKYQIEIYSFQKINTLEYKVTFYAAGYLNHITCSPIFKGWLIKAA